MKLRALQAFSLIVFMLLSFSVKAQLDSSSAVLLHSGGDDPNADDLDSSRYKVRTLPKPRARVEPTETEEAGTLIASPVPKSASKEKVSTNTPVHVETAPAAPAPPTAPVPIETKPTAAKTELEIEPERPPVTVQVQQLLLGGSEEDIEDAKKQIHPQDPRANMVSVSFAPAYFYDGSTSNYSFHNFHSGGPGFGLSMNLWLSPFFGVQSKYLTSVSSSVGDGQGGVVPMTTQEFEAGVRFRRHFGFTRKSAQLSWGVDYRDSSNHLSGDSTVVVGQSMSGLSFTLEGEVPSSNTYAHLFSVSLRPYQHSSESNTSMSVSSGSSPATNGVALSLGGQWTLDRHDQVFWKAEYNVEQTLYGGTASTLDPKTNATPSGVTVTNSLSIFYFGFKWGS